MAKEIKVQLYANENDDYNELWKVIDEEKYYARHTYHNAGIWYHVCDPLGYCELDSPVSNDVTFIMCDSEGNECFRYSNDEPNPLPKFADYIKQEWQKVKNTIQHNTERDDLNFWTMCFSGETVRKLEQWLVSFMDKDLYPKEIAEMNGYDINWYGCWHNKETEYTPIPNSQFEYLGKKYQFIKVHHKHDICGVEWDTFECCDNPIQMGWWGTESHPQVQSYMEMGNWFDESIKGTMYDSMTARNLVSQKLRELFPIEKDYQNLIYVEPKPKDNNTWRVNDVCYIKTYGDCAEALIKRDYHIKAITELLDNLSERTKDIIFVNNKDNRELVRKLYPEIYCYDSCII